MVRTATPSRATRLTRTPVNRLTRLGSFANLGIYLSHLQIVEWLARYTDASSMTDAALLFARAVALSTGLATLSYLLGCRWMSVRGWPSVFAGFALITLALMPPGNVSGDGASMLGVGTSLATGDGFAVPCGFGIAGRDGQCFSTYYPLQSILAVPFIAVGRAFGGLASASPSYLGGLAAQALPALAAAGVAGLTVHFALLLGASRKRALLAGITILFATEIATYYRSFFAETLAALLVCLMVWGFLRDDRWRAVAPVAVIGVILTKPQLVLVGLAVGAVLAVMQHRRRPLVEAFVATVTATVIYAGYNALRFSDFTNFGGEARTYDASSFAPLEVLEATALLLVSPGRGWFVYSPIVIVGIYYGCKMRGSALAIAAFSILLATLIPYLGNPGSGFNWGSRYLVPAIPLFVALAWAAPTRQWLAPTAATLGLIIAAPTFPAFYQRSYAEQAAAGNTPTDVYWNVTEAPLVHMWEAMPHQVSAAKRTDVKQLADEPEATTATAASTVEGQKFFRVVALWWWMTPVADVPRPAGFLVALVMLVTGFTVVGRAGRHLR